MRDQQLELFYSQSGMLYEILPDSPGLMFNKTKQKSGPHVNGLIGSA
jgi:hypothetical protein